MRQTNFNVTASTLWPSQFDPLAVLTLLPTAALLLDETGRVRWCNGAARQALGDAATASGAIATDAFATGRDWADGALLQASATGQWLRLRLAAHSGGSLLSLEVLEDAGALDAARQEAERHKAFLDLAQRHGRLGMWRRDPHTMQGEWDRHVFEFWGLQPSDAAPDFQVALAAIVAEDREGLANKFQSSLKLAGSHAHRYRVRRADGQVRHLHSHWQVKADAQGSPTHVIGVIIDDTEALARAQSHFEAPSQLVLAEDLAGIARWVQDLRTQRMFYNRHAADIVGLRYRPEGMSFSEFRSLVHVDDLPALDEAGERTVRTGEATDVEARYRRSDGSWRLLLTRRMLQRDEAGVPTAIIGIAIDLTERREADLALRRANERAALAARGMGMGTWEIDMAAGQTHWDEQMWRLRGRSLQANAPTLEQRLHMVHPDDRGLTRERNARTSFGTQVFEHEFRVLWPDGSVHWLASRSGPVLNHAGQVVRRMGVNWDVTGARQAVEERQARELAQQASRAKSDFLSRMSHELRTPLNAVIGFSQLLLESHRRQDDPEREQLTAVLAGGRHLLALINDMLDLTSLDDGQLRIEAVAVDLPALIREALPLVEPMRQAHGLAAVEVDLQNATVVGDKTRLRQVLINLLSNAIKYNLPGGRVRLETRVSGAVATMVVIDTGRGLSTEQQAQLFQPFNRLGVEALGIEGTGIGLAITKALVERMGGSVSVQSRPDQGSRFTVSLPTHAAHSPPNSPPNSMLQSLPSHVRADGSASERALALDSPADNAVLPGPGGSVLYIEDNPVNMLLMDQVLAQVAGVTMRQAVDGRSGVASAIAQRPDLVLLDMHLPDADGHEVFRQLQAHPATAGVRCIAVSANAMPDEIARARDVGFVDYWTKPFDIQSVVTAVAQYLAPD